MESSPRFSLNAPRMQVLEVENGLTLTASLAHFHHRITTSLYNLLIILISISSDVHIWQSLGSVCSVLSFHHETPAERY